MLRRFSWIFGFLAWVIPPVMFGLAWWQRQQLFASRGEEPTEDIMWLMSTITANLLVGAVISLFAVILGIIALSRIPKDAVFNPVLRILECILLAMPLLACCFAVGSFLVHG